MGARLCVLCRKHKALFISPNWRKVKADRHHDICQQCFHAMRNRHRPAFNPNRRRDVSDASRIP